MNEVTTKCINGSLRTGDLVLSVPEDCYSCLIGRVLEIHPVGTPEHDAETANETDAVHVDFTEYGYTCERIKEIEALFSAYYGEKKRYNNLPLDDVIMSPDSLIRITDIADDSLLCVFKESGYNVACYCYKVLRQLYEDHADDKDISQIVLPLSNGMVLSAKVNNDPTYPSINTSLQMPDGTENCVCFAELNTSRREGRQICVCAYAHNTDEPTYYASYHDDGSPCDDA